MVRTRSQRILHAIEGRLAIKTAKVRERIFGIFGYDTELPVREYQFEGLDVRSRKLEYARYFNEVERERHMCRVENLPAEIVVEMGSSSVNEVSTSGRMSESNSEVEVGSKTDVLKEVKQLDVLKASDVVTIGQLQVEVQANLDEMVEERDRLGRHLMLKGYSEEEVDVIKADTYVEEGDDEEVEVVVVVDGLNGVFHQTVPDNQGDGTELPEGDNEKALSEMSLKIKDLEIELVREKKISTALLSAQAKL
ncbi:hypothetical protein GIB67_027642 [Kingdonia uniflora]|uniref:Uncharacterized protein n=1 Tax=Kingdonia uniflora TaxID=39325 RepID=A0A7J7NLK5_9MAGN|nr:hypothetical protein GIB67_027642 [Kingdonia uniflora]